MVSSLSQSAKNRSIGFSVFDQLSYSGSSLPFGNVLSADRVREMFADSGVLFGYGENDLWNTGGVRGDLEIVLFVVRTLCRT